MSSHRNIERFIRIIARDTAVQHVFMENMPHGPAITILYHDGGVHTLHSYREADQYLRWTHPIGNLRQP